MKATAALQHGMRIVLFACTGLLLLLSNLYLMATPAYVRYEYGKPSFPTADIYGPKERQALSEATVHYLRSGEGVDYLRNLQSQGQGVYNEREIQHLVDVKVVINAAFAVQTVCAVLVLGVLVLAWRKHWWRAALRMVYQSCLALLLALVALGVLAYTSFDVFFTAFHRVFFSGDSWLFAYTDTLIQLYPVPFWMDATWILALLSLTECVVVGTLAYVLYRRQERVL